MAFFRMFVINEAPLLHARTTYDRFHSKIRALEAIALNYFAAATTIALQHYGQRSKIK